MNTSASQNKGNLSIGAFFTPLEWAEFVAEKFGFFGKWMGGATIFDPTMGEGNLLEALITIGIKRGQSPKELPIQNLYGVELNRQYFQTFFMKMKQKYDIDFPAENFCNEDIFFQRDERVFDAIFSNPPWQNFVDLPESYKPQIKERFHKYDLIENAKDLLLGGSRIDIAALVIQKTIAMNLKEGGEAVYFLPLSLLLNDGANQFFRKYKVNGVCYRIDKIIDFNDLDIFGVATRYGVVHIMRDCKQSFPIDYDRWEKGKWKPHFANPIFNENDPLSISEESESSLMAEFEPIAVQKYAAPRQGLNTCGANEIFIFDHTEDKGINQCLVSNKSMETLLPKKFLYPLITGKNFSEENPVPHKWVLFPHNNDGRPLEIEQIEREASLKKYLDANRKVLENRKGTLINVWIKKGYWWALFGIGDYCFYPYKVVWEAYGKIVFRPRIFPGNWQVNQSLQAFMPAKTLNEAESLLHKLSDKRVESYLLSLKMEGTMNWAQPGKIKKLLCFAEEQTALFAIQ